MQFLTSVIVLIHFIFIVKEWSTSPLSDRRSNSTSTALSSSTEDLLWLVDISPPIQMIHDKNNPKGAAVEEFLERRIKFHFRNTPNPLYFIRSYSKSTILWYFESIMEEDSDTPVGVKMLADHLVKVKLQYEGTLRSLHY